jgi:hypothetical protein
MTEVDDREETLRRLWRGNDAMTPRERILLVRLIQEKQASFRELVTARAKGNYALLFSLATVAFWAAYRARWFWAKVGYGVFGATYVAGIAVVWAFSRIKAERPEPAVDTRDYCSRQVRLYDRQIRLLTSTTWWLVLPLSLGVIAIACGVWAHTGRIWPSLLLAVTAPALTWLATSRGCLREVKQIRLKRRELAALLSEAVLLE